MFKIGDFAQLGRVTVRTLHHYEELGLLCPAHIDPASGYRYYGLEQLPRLNRILALKDLGLSLDEIGLLLNQALSARELRAILRVKQAELAAQVAETQERLARVEVRLKLIEEEGKMPDYEVILKDVAPLRVAIKYGTIPTFDQTTPTLNRLFDEVWEYVDRHAAADQSGPGLDLWYDMGEGDSQRDIHVSAAIPFTGSLPEGEGVKVETLPAATMACAVHHGSFAGFQRAYQALMSWIEANGYQIVGPNREIYLQYERNGDPADYVTEIQFPVAKV